MNPSYQWVNFGRESSSFNQQVIIDIMGAPISSPEEFEEYIGRFTTGSNILCLSGELKRCGEGRPASNYRLEHDEILNENVIKNYFHLCSNITKKPIIVTTIPREMRNYSWFLTEKGDIIRKDQEYRRRANDPEDPIHYTGFPSGDETIHDIVDENFMNMLYKFGIDSDKLKIIRESCKNSRYHSYMIDMISFIYQTMIDTSNFHKMFQAEYKTISCVLGGEKVDKWIPKENINYLYFEDCHDEYGSVYFVPRNESITEIYHLFDLIINPYENKAKESVRSHLNKFSIHRWSDFDANDTDDIFTIIMILHCYSCDTIDNEPISLTKNQYDIKRNLESIINSWKNMNSI